MNHNNVVTHVAATALNAHTIVQFTTFTGLSRGQAPLTNAVAVQNPAAAVPIGNPPTAGTAIGTVLQDVEQGGPADIFLFSGGGVHYVTAGSDTAIAPLNLLDMGPNGTLVLHAGGTAVAIAMSASNGTGTIFNAMFL